MPPSRLNLFALDQPPMSVPMTPTPMTARTKNSPMSRSSPTRPGPIGTTRSATRYGSRANAGAIWKIVRSAPAGTTSSFCTNFTPSATSCAQPWNIPAYIGPTRLCMCAIALCSTCPTSSGSTRNAAITTSTRSSASTSSGIGALLGRAVGGARTPLLGRGDARRAGPATRRGAGRRVVALAGLLGAGPGLGDPRGEHELLAQRVTLELLGQEQLVQREHRTGVAEVDAEHLVGLLLVPPGTREHVGQRVDDRLVARHQGAYEEVLDAAGTGLPARGLRA